MYQAKNDKLGKWHELIPNETTYPKTNYLQYLIIRNIKNCLTTPLLKTAY